MWWLGQWKNRCDTPFNFNWPTDPICALGVFFSYDTTKANKLNYGKDFEYLEKSKSNLNWQNKHRQNASLAPYINLNPKGHQLKMKMCHRNPFCPKILPPAQFIQQ